MQTCCDAAPTLGRRALLVGTALTLIAPARAVAQAGAGLTADDGSPMRSFPAPDRARLLSAPGLLTAGPAEADVIVSEFFDYNCGYCRQAAPGLDQMLRENPKLRLAFVQNPILSAASARAAEAIAAVLALHGAAIAYDIHNRVLAASGRASEQTVFDAARDRGLDVARIQRAMSDAAVLEALRAQRQLAIDGKLGFTPTFVVGDLAFIGWPGVATMQRFVAATQRCGSPRCSAEPTKDRS